MHPGPGLPSIGPSLNTIQVLVLFSRDSGAYFGRYFWAAIRHAELYLQALDDKARIPEEWLQLRKMGSMVDTLKAFRQQMSKVATPPPTGDRKFVSRATLVVATAVSRSEHSALTAISPLPTYCLHESTVSSPSPVHVEPSTVETDATTQDNPSTPG